MNIKIVDSWLREYLETDARPDEIGRYLSLHGPSVEKIEKIGQDYVYDIEITTNRIDSGSVFGIGQECQAILPFLGKKARLRFNPLDKYRLSTLTVDSHYPLSLDVRINNQNLCSRFTAVVLDNVKIGPAPEFISNRLRLCGIKSINNVVDISNYLMISLGQPTHIFDYDKIGRHQIVMRESRPGEEIITLDEKKIKLAGGDIVIEDGDKKLIDLCGIMGGLNSAVDNNTKKIVLFVQTYNKKKIRRTTMTTGQRTVAATYFEKGLDEERVEPTLVYGLELLKKHAAAKIASRINDIYPHPYREKTITVSRNIFAKMMGIKVDLKKAELILKNLGFKLHQGSSSFLKIAIPSYRRDDINIPQDIVEEVARIYGYHNLPGHLPPPAHIEQPKAFAQLFVTENKTKHFLKNLGLHEVMNYSMISETLIRRFSLDPKDHLRLANPISQEIEYMRKSLIPSLSKNMDDNFGKRNTLKFFEISRTYQPRSAKLPREKYQLAIAVNTDFFDLKGIIEALFRECNITARLDWQPSIEETYFHQRFFSPKTQMTILVGNRPVGFLGRLKTSPKIFAGEIDLQFLIDYSQSFPPYQPINPYAVVQLDLTIPLSKKQNFLTIKNLALANSKLIKTVELVSLFKNKATLRFYFTSTKKNITEDEAKKELKKIKAGLNNSLDPQSS